MFASCRSVLLVFVMLFGAELGVAQQPNPQFMQQLQTYMTRPDFAKELGYIVREYEKPRRGECAEVQVERVAHMPVTPIAFDAAGVPANGSWRTQISVNRCGAQVIHNVLYQASDGKIVPNGMFPGLTRTPLKMQDAVAIKMRSFLQAALPASDCRLFVIMDTQIERQPSTTSPDRWTERWSIQQCDRLDDVLIDFQLDTRGAINFSYRLS